VVRIPGLLSDRLEHCHAWGRLSEYIKTDCLLTAVAYCLTSLHRCHTNGACYRRNSAKLRTVFRGVWASCDPIPIIYRLAHALASSFNFQGRVKKTFYVLTDDKVGAGPRLRPNSLAKEPNKDPDQESVQGSDTTQPMETDPPTAPTAPTAPPVLSLSAKLAAKRKATESAAETVAKARR
jgi:hypothetical protein